MALFTARQVAKTTFIAASIACGATMMPQGHQVVVLPLQEQAFIFSMQRLQPFLTRSPILHDYFFSDGKKIDQVLRKELTNGHLISIGYAQRTADRLRGQSLKAGTNPRARPILAYDEYQDIFPDVIPVVKELALRVLAKYLYTGTPKTLGNHMEALRARSTGCEWAVRCEATGCKKWNLRWDEVNVGDFGVICQHCGQPLNTLRGTWVAARKLDPERGRASKYDVEGYRISQLIVQPVMSNPLKWRELLGKMRDYSDDQVKNEIFGLPTALGAKPTTLDHLRQCCVEGRPNARPKRGTPGYPPLMLGMDWAIVGEKSFTFATIGGWTSFPSLYDVYYWKCFEGSESDPKYQIRWVVDTFRECGIAYVGSDWGSGQVQNIEIINEIGENRLVQLWHTGMKSQGGARSRAKWEPKTRKWHLARTRVMTDLFTDINKLRIRFPAEGECGRLFEHILAVNTEWNKAMNSVFYTHVLADDGFHSLLFGQLAGELYTHGDFRGHLGEEEQGSLRQSHAQEAFTDPTDDGWQVNSSFY